MVAEITIPKNIRDILSQCYAKNDKFNVKRFNILKTKEVDDYLIEIDAKPVELFYLFKHNLKSFPVCKTCGKRLRNDWYHKPREYCCSKCESNSPIVKDKKEKTTLKHFGVKCSLQNKEVQEKIKNTCIKLYGKANYIQSDDYKDKTAKTLEEKYGENVINVFQANEIKEKIKQTNNEKYGVDNPQQNKEISEKTTKTFIEKYGVGNPNNLHNEMVSKRKETCIERFGVDAPAKNKDIFQKSLKTNLKRYGTEYPCHFISYKIDNITFDSSWEVAFYIYYRDKGCSIKRNDVKFRYNIDNEEHTTIIDFTIDNKLYEVKSSYLIEQQQEKIECLKKNNVNIISDNEIRMYIDYVNEKYGKDYIEQFKVR